MFPCPAWWKKRPDFSKISSNKPVGAGPIRDSLGWACVRGLARGAARLVLVDAGMGGRRIKAGVLLGAGLALAQRLKQEVS